MIGTDIVCEVTFERSRHSFGKKARISAREALTKKVNAILLRNWMRLTASHHIYGWNCKAGLVGELVDDNFWPSIQLLPVGQIKASSARPG